MLWFPWQVLCRPGEPREAQRGHNGPATHPHQRRPAGRAGGTADGAAQHRGTLAARGTGWLVADARGHPRFQRWGRALLRLLGGAVELPALSPRGSSCSAPVGSGARAGPRCSPCSHFLLFSAGFPSSWVGCFLRPASLSIQGWCGSLLCPSSSRADPGEPAEQPKQGSGESCSPQHRCKPGATEQR